jgi:hypothetical protein
LTAKPFEKNFKRLKNHSKYDDLVKSLKRLFYVIPAQAGIQYFHVVRIFWIPVFTGVTTFYESIKNIGEKSPRRFKIPHPYPLFLRPLSCSPVRSKLSFHSQFIVLTPLLTLPLISRLHFPFATSAGKEFALSKSLPIDAKEGAG